MTHLTVLPVVLPIMAAVLSLFAKRDVSAQRAVSFVALAANAAIAALLVQRAATGAIDVYALGSWPPPFGIVLVADRLSALMVAITAVISIPVFFFAAARGDAKGAHFHPLLLLQIAGLNGAFLTGDAFNLFVFFEVLLIASYGLLVHGGGADRVRGGLHYVVVNLVGSTLFLFALAMIYGTLGTLNIADIAGRVAVVPEADRAIVAAAFTLLIIVFALKAAIAPLFLWLPRAYPVAPYAIAALFAVMTKVGIYAILRFHSAVLTGNGFGAGLVDDWLFPLAIATIALGVFGLFCAKRLTEVASQLVLVSSGTLAAAIAMGGEALLSAVVFYLPHTIVTTTALFLTIGVIGRSRAMGDAIERCQPIPATGLMATAFLASGVAIAGLPPLSGFVGKWMLLKGAVPSTETYVFWAALILSGFAAALVLARTGSRVFWEPVKSDVPDGAAETEKPPGPMAGESGAMLLATAAMILVVVFAAPLDRYARQTAAQLTNPAIYRSAVIPTPDTIIRGVRP